MYCLLYCTKCIVYWANLKMKNITSKTLSENQLNVKSPCINFCPRNRKSPASQIHGHGHLVDSTLRVFLVSDPFNVTATAIKLPQTN